MCFLVHKVIRNRSSWGPCQFLIFVTKHLVKNIPIYLSGNMKEFIWKKSGKAKNLYGNVQDFEKWWTEKVEEFVWKKYGTMMNLTEKVEEFVTWKSIVFQEMYSRICMEMWRIFKDKNEKYMVMSWYVLKWLTTNSSQKWKNLYVMSNIVYIYILSVL